MANPKFPSQRPMNVHVARGSKAEHKYRTMAGIPDLVPEALAPGLPATPAHDLLFHGGKTIPDLEYTNLYVGGNAWAPGDITRIDGALADAMSEPTLNNVMAQYFSATPTTSFKPSRTLPGAAPIRFSQGDVEALLSGLVNKSQLEGYSYPSTVFNFLLPQGTILSDSPTVGADNEADSLNGLGGFHGSIVVGAKTLYYAIGVYSERRPDGTANGIPVFDAAWKNVVATFYHELCEARTDPDVQQVIAGGPSTLLGWASKSGEECGDFPVFEANPLSLVFQEIPLTKGGTVPVQFQYSNFVHGPEGPVATPHRPVSAGKHQPPKHRPSKHR